MGIGSYRIDLHPDTARHGYVDISCYPFQIPLGALLPVQPVQRGLNGERAGDDRLRAAIAEVETLEPGGPMAVEETLDADLVTGGLS